MIRQSVGGVAIDVEVCSLPLERVGGFLAGIPAPLGLSSVELADGTWEKRICECHAAEGVHDTTDLGGWRGFVAGSSRQDEMPRV